MSMKLENKDSTGVDKDPFSQLSLGIERLIRKKKATNDDDQEQSLPDKVKQPTELAAPAQTRASSDAAATVMAHWSDQKSPTSAPIDTLTTADRMRLMDKRRIINDPKSNTKDQADKGAEPSKAQSRE